MKKVAIKQQLFKESHKMSHLKFLSSSVEVATNLEEVNLVL